MATVYGNTAVTIRDYRGYTARVSVLLLSDTALNLLAQAATFATDVIACSNGILARQTGTNTQIEEALTYGAAAQYADCGQKLAIVGISADGRLHRLSVPCPKASCFLTDQVTMNVADTAVAALITFLNAHWATNDGDESPITVMSGSFADRRRRRRLGRWTRTAIGGAAPN